MKKEFRELQKQIRDTVREAAQNIKCFRETGNGAIRITAYPCCKEADEWFGGLGEFRPAHQSVDAAVLVGWDNRPDDIPDYEVVFSITSGGSPVINYDGEDDKKHKCNCYAFSAMKIAHCSLAQHMGAGLSSGVDLNDPDAVEENGYGPYKGAPCATVCTIIENDSADKESTKALPFCGIYVCVSGASPEQDEKCAAAGIRAIEKFFRDERSTFGYLKVYSPV